MELDIYGFFEAEGEVELKRLQNGWLIPNTLDLKAASEVGIPLVPPVVVAELNGLGGGFRGLADTIKGDFFAIPPIKLTLHGKASVLEMIEGWATVTVGPGYYGASLSEVEILGLPIVKEFCWYYEVAGDIRKYGGNTYRGMKVGGGFNIDLGIPEGDPVIEAKGSADFFAFAGLDSFANPKNLYLLIDAQGKIYGGIKVPKGIPVKRT